MKKKETIVEGFDRKAKGEARKIKLKADTPTEEIKREKLKKIKKEEIVDETINGRVARVMYLQSKHPFFYDERKFFWLWNKDRYCYEETDEIGLLNLLDKELKLRGWVVFKKYKQEYVDALKIIGRRKKPKEPPKHWIQFGKWVVFLPKEPEWHEKRGMEAHPGYFFTNPIPYSFSTKEEGSETPVMDKLFKEWVGEKYVKTLYQIIAYCCLRDYPIQTVFCFVGSGRNGKSKFQSIVQKFLGIKNICSARLTAIANPNNKHETTKLFQKLCCFMGETNFGQIDSTDTFKQITGEDLIDFEFKYKNSFVSYNYAKIMINSNSLPTSTDTSDGFFRRWFIIDFPNEFPEGRDILKDIPEEEYNKLARKCVEILPNLLEEGKFINQGTIEERKRRYKMKSNPFDVFIKECCMENPEYYILSTELYNAYCKYLRILKNRVVSRSEYNKALNEEGLLVQNTKREHPTKTHNGFPLVECGWMIIGMKLKENFETFINKR